MGYPDTLVSGWVSPIGGITDSSVFKRSNFQGPDSSYHQDVMSPMVLKNLGIPIVEPQFMYSGKPISVVMTMTTRLFSTLDVF